MREISFLQILAITVTTGIFLVALWYMAYRSERNFACYFYFLLFSSSGTYESNIENF